VPLVIEHPGSVAAGSRSTAAAGLVDVAPTVLELLGLPPAAGMAGRSLLGDPAASTGSTEPELLIESVLPAEAYGWSPLGGVVAGRFKYIHAPLPELYDLVADPAESANLWDPGGADSRRMARTWSRALARLEPLPGGARELGGEEERALRSLGYVFGGGSPGHEGAPDPKAMVGFVDRLKHAAGLVAERRFAAARPLLEELLAADPASYDALWMLGEVELKAGRLDRAGELFARAAEARPGKGQALIGLGKIARARGRAAEARELFERATGDPESADAWLNLAVARLDAGDPGRAASTLETAAERFPYSEKVHYSLALVYLRQGRTDEAHRANQRALRLVPGYPPARELASRLGGEQSR
jgi:tetratricopeptide (TPR) repeat protein